MSTAKFIEAHGKEILIVILTVLLTTLGNTTIGVVNLRKSFEDSQRKEVATTLRVETALLNNVAVELDKNMQLLSNNDYRTSIAFEAAPKKMDDMKDALKGVKGKTTRQMNAWFEAFGKMEENNLRLTNVNIPRVPLLVDMWPRGRGNVVEIDFQLTQDLNDIYRNFERINEGIKLFAQVDSGSIANPPTVEHIRRESQSMNIALDALPKEKLMAIVASVNKDIVRLREERKKILRE